MTKRVVKRTRRIVPRKRSAFTLRGAANYALLAMLLLIIGLSVFFVSNTKFSSTEKTQLVNTYSCCDSGDGDACVTNPSVTLTLNGSLSYRGRTKTFTNEVYHLLKTNIKLKETWGHLEPVPSALVSGLPANQYVYLNTTDWPWGGSAPYTKELECSKGDVTQDQLASGAGGCTPIPDDTLIYVCTKGCEENQEWGSEAILSAYFRAKDLPNIPDVIKNCSKPEETMPQEGKQRIVNPPEFTEKKNLQLETFTVTQDHITADWVSPYCKPAIYLYPEQKTYAAVRVLTQYPFTLTIPKYPKQGWSVMAHPDGSIYSGLQRYDYLYYETELPDAVITLPQEGYVVTYADLTSFVPSLVKQLGLNAFETKQFSDYWIGVLPESPYYQIKIVERELLDKVAGLDIVPRPDTIIRVTLHFTPLEAPLVLDEPTVAPVVRRGFTVVEWGGIYKRYNNKPFSCFM